MERPELNNRDTQYANILGSFLRWTNDGNLLNCVEEYLGDQGLDPKHIERLHRHPSIQKIGSSIPELTRDEAVKRIINDLNRLGYTAAAAYTENFVRSRLGQPVEQTQSPTTEAPQTREYNLFTNFAATYAALIKLEGEEWFARDDVQQSLRNAMEKARNGDGDSGIFFGKSGTNRYRVDPAGKVYFGRLHGKKSSIQLAEELGFEIE